MKKNIFIILLLLQSCTKGIKEESVPTSLKVFLSLFEDKDYKDVIESWKKGKYMLVKSKRISEPLVLQFLCKTVNNCIYTDSDIKNNYDAMYKVKLDSNRYILCYNLIGRSLKIETYMLLFNTKKQLFTSELLIDGFDSGHYGIVSQITDNFHIKITKDYGTETYTQNDSHKIWTILEEEYQLKGDYFVLVNSELKINKLN